MQKPEVEDCLMNLPEVNFKKVEQLIARPLTNIFP